MQKANVIRNSRNYIKFNIFSQRMIFPNFEIFSYFHKKIIYFKKLNYLKIIRFLKISKILKFQKWNRFRLKIEIFNKKSQKWPLQNYCTQMEIPFPLSPGAHTQPKSNFNTWRILSMWHIFISTWFYQRETCSKRSKS